MGNGAGAVVHMEVVSLYTCTALMKPAFHPAAARGAGAPPGKDNSMSYEDLKQVIGVIKNHQIEER